MERLPRSNKYQYLILETVSSDDFLNSFDNTQSLAGHLNPFQYSEEVLEWKDKLNARIWELAEIHCTPHQLETMKWFYQDGYTQQEIAKIRKCNQSSVVKCLLGNADYSKGTKKTYGGIIPKMRNVLTNDPVFQELLTKIKDAQEPTY